MKLQHLRFFTAVVESGGVIKASERLHISQPAVSTGLKALEDELGGVLFDRGPNRRLNLTPAGRRFYKQATDILRQCDTAKSDFSDTCNKITEITMGVLDTLPMGELAILVGRLAERRPDWKVKIWEGSNQRLITWLGQGRIELALANVQGLSDVERALWREPLVAVVSPAHRFADLREHSISLEQLAEEPFLHRSRCELDALGRVQLQAAGITLRVVVRGERDDLIFELVKRGLGITLAPRSLVPAQLIPIPVRGMAVSRQIGLQWHGATDTDIIETVSEEILEIHSSQPACFSGCVTQSEW